MLNFLGVAELVRVLGNPPFEPEDDEVHAVLLNFHGL